MKKSSRSILAVSFTLILILFSEHDYILELWQRHEESGSLTVVIIGLYTLIHRIIRNHKYDARDAAIFHNQKILMQSMGVSDQWRGPPRKLRNADLKSFMKLSLSSRKVIDLDTQLRRKKTMNQNINYFTLFASIASAIKLILQPFGIDIPDEHVNALVNGAASLVVIIGIMYNHIKPAKGGAINESTQHYTGGGPMV